MIDRKKKNLEISYIMLSKEYWRLKTQAEIFETQAKYVKSKVDKIEKELEELKKPKLRLIKKG